MVIEILICFIAGAIFLPKLQSALSVRRSSRLTALQEGLSQSGLSREEQMQALVVRYEQEHFRKALTVLLLSLPFLVMLLGRGISLLLTIPL
jgi:hypothetical protein